MPRFTIPGQLQENDYYFGTAEEDLPWDASKPLRTNYLPDCTLDMLFQECTVRCPACEGSGEHPFAPTSCAECAGSGEKLVISEEEAGPGLEEHPLFTASCDCCGTALTEEQSYSCTFPGYPGEFTVCRECHDQEMESRDLAESHLCG